MCVCVCVCVCVLPLRKINQHNEKLLSTKHGEIEGLVFDQLEIKELSSGNNGEFRLEDIGQPLLFIT